MRKKKSDKNDAKKFAELVLDMEGNEFTMSKARELTS